MKQQKGFALIPVIIILAVLAIGGYWWYDSNRTIGPGLPPVPTLTKKPSDQTEVPGNWQTYRNEQYGFEVKYPKDWIYRTRNVDKDILLDFTSIKAGWPSEQTDARPPIAIRLTSNDPSPNWQSKYFNEYKSKSYIVGNIVGTKISGINKVSLGQELVVIGKFGNTYIEAMPNDFGEETLGKFDQILSTFKFLK